MDVSVTSDVMESRFTLSAFDNDTESEVSSSSLLKSVLSAFLASETKFLVSILLSSDNLALSDSSQRLSSLSDSSDDLSSLSSSSGLSSARNLVVSSSVVNSSLEASSLVKDSLSSVLSMSSVSSRSSLQRSSSGDSSLVSLGTVVLVLSAVSGRSVELES